MALLWNAGFERQTVLTSPDLTSQSSVTIGRAELGFNHVDPLSISRQQLEFIFPSPALPQNHHVLAGGTVNINTGKRSLSNSLPLSNSLEDRGGAGSNNNSSSFSVRNIGACDLLVVRASSAGGDGGSSSSNSGMSSSLLLTVKSEGSEPWQSVELFDNSVVQFRYAGGTSGSKSPNPIPLQHHDILMIVPPALVKQEALLAQQQQQQQQQIDSDNNNKTTTLGRVVAQLLHPEHANSLLSRGMQWIFVANESVKNSLERVSSARASRSEQNQQQQPPQRDSSSSFINSWARTLTMPVVGGGPGDGRLSTDFVDQRKSSAGNSVVVSARNSSAVVRQTTTVSTTNNNNKNSNNGGGVTICRSHHVRASDSALQTLDMVRIMSSNSNNNNTAADRRRGRESTTSFGHPPPPFNNANANANHIIQVDAENGVVRESGRTTSTSGQRKTGSSASACEEQQQQQQRQQYQHPGKPGLSPLPQASPEKKGLQQQQQQLQMKKKVKGDIFGGSPHLAGAHGRNILTTTRSHANGKSVAASAVTTTNNSMGMGNNDGDEEEEGDLIKSSSVTEMLKNNKSSAGSSVSGSAFLRNSFGHQGSDEHGGANNVCGSLNCANDDNNQQIQSLGFLGDGLMNNLDAIEENDDDEDQLFPAPVNNNNNNNQQQQQHDNSARSSSRGGTLGNSPGGSARKKGGGGSSKKKQRRSGSNSHQGMLLATDDVLLDRSGVGGTGLAGTTNSQLVSFDHYGQHFGQQQQQQQQVVDVDKSREESRQSARGSKYNTVE